MKDSPYPKTLKRIALLRVAALVMQIEVTDVAGGAVAVHNVPGEGDVGAVCVATWKVLTRIATQRKGMGRLHSV